MDDRGERDAVGCDLLAYGSPAFGQTCNEARDLAVRRIGVSEQADRPDDLDVDQALAEFHGIIVEKDDPIPLLLDFVDAKSQAHTLRVARSAEV